MATNLRLENILLVCLLACSAAGPAEAQAPLPFDQMLARVEENTEAYRATVPSFLCDEHITSEEDHAGKIKHETTADAVFSVMRSAVQADGLEESREIRAIDGRPSEHKKLNLPIAFSGGFSGALTKFLSASHRACFDYEPDGSKTLPAGTIGFTFAAKNNLSKDPACASIQPGTRGRVLVDAATMQVTHVERTVANPVGRDRAVLGTASVDFAAVTLGSRSFWLPVTITAFTTETARTNGFRFTAHYSNYHRFGATSTIHASTPDAESGPL